MKFPKFLIGEQVYFKFGIGQIGSVRDESGFFYLVHRNNGLPEIYKEDDLDFVHPSGFRIIFGLPVIVEDKLLVSPQRVLLQNNARDIGDLGVNGSIPTQICSTVIPSNFDTFVLPVIRDFSLATIEYDLPNVKPLVTKTFKKVWCTHQPYDNNPFRVWLRVR